MFFVNTINCVYDIKIYFFSDIVCCKHNSYRNFKNMNCILHIMLLPLSLSIATSCKVVTFLSGGKCGSTALASYMKHKAPSYTVYDPNSQFVDAGKELCGYHFDCKKNKMILDACPRRITHRRALLTIKIDPNPVGILLVRNQADALLSLYRDKASSGPVTVTADEWALKHKANQEYNFTAVYTDSKRWGIQNIIVVKSVDLVRLPNKTVNGVFVKLGIPEYLNIPPLVFNNPTQSARYRPGALSYVTRQRIESYWHATNLELAKLTHVII